jgi:putative integral membrane protein (TIGR02587 family)
LAQAAAVRHGRDDPFGWRQEGCDLLRALAAGAIVGMPLLYTMEMWWSGMVLSEWHLLGLLGAILVVNFLFSILSGFRNEYTIGAAAADSVTAVGIGILFSGAILFVIGELDRALSPAELMGKVLVEAAVVSLGASFANMQLRGRSRTGEDDNGGGGGKNPKEPHPDPESAQLQADLKDVAATLIGATIFALNIAPTEEVLLIAARLEAWQQLLMLGTGLVLCYVILFASGFEKHQVHVESVFQHPVAETVMACAISLVVAFALLALLGQREALAGFNIGAASVITLGLPAIVGGAAGRLIV